VLLRSALALLAFLAGSILSPEEKALIQDISQSGRCATLVDTPDDRVTTRTLISPGPPPLLSFRFYQGKLHHRFGNSELMLDDAGH
jgi:hypothetical protein